MAAMESGIAEFRPMRKSPSRSCVLTLLLIGLACWETHAGNYVVGWGSYSSSADVIVRAPILDAATVGAGQGFSVIVRSNGTVIAWGNNNAAVQTNVPAGLSNVIAVSCWRHVLALRSNGTVVAWGNGSVETSVPGNLSNVTAVAAGGSHSLALKADGTVVGWGWYLYGAADPPPGLSNVVAIAAGESHSLALKSDGTVVTWGFLTNTPVGLTNVAAIAAGSYFSLALKSNGTVIAWDSNTWWPTNVPPGLTNIFAIAGGGNSSVGLRSDGSVVFWNANGVDTNAIVPQGVTNLSAISYSGGHTLAINDGSPYIVFEPGSPYVPYQPGSSTIYSGTSAYFSVFADGQPPLSYQWRFKGTNIVGATNQTFSFDNAQTTDSGPYTVVVSNSVRSVESFGAILTVNNSGPLIQNPPASQNVMMGSTVTIGSAFPATGSQPFTYQWRNNNVNIPGATNVQYSITNVQPSHTGLYRVLVSNAYGSALSANATISVVDLVEALDNPSLDWVTSGDASWRPVNTFIYTGFAGIAAASGAITNNQSSRIETLVNGPATLTFWWQVSSEPLDDYLNFALDAVERARISGQSYWQKRTEYLTPGSHTLQWTYTKGPSGSGGQDMAWLDQVLLVPGGTAPFITSQPANQAFRAGSNISFSVSANGTPSLSYQWQFNGNNIPNATNSLLTLTNVQTGNAGNYRAIVTNAFGSTNSSTAALFLFVGPGQPQDAIDRWYFRSDIVPDRIRFVGNRFVGVGTNGLIVTSTNGVNWEIQNSGTTNDLRGVANGVTAAFDQIFIVVGEKGTILRSADGITWTNIPTAYNQDLNDVAYTSFMFKFVATTTRTSTGQPNVLLIDNINPVSGVIFLSGPDRVHSIDVSGTTLIAAGSSSIVDDLWRSLNGTSWQRITNSGQSIGGIAHGNGRFLTVGYEGGPAISTNQGLKWEFASSALFTNLMVGADVAFGNSGFLTARANRWGLLTTADGFAWEQRTAFTGDYIISVAFGNGTFVVVSRGGVLPAGIYQSESVLIPMLSINRQAPGVLLRLSGEIGHAYQIQSSTDLQTWSNRWDFTLPSSATQFMDSATDPLRFYRGVRP
jgi:Immunoglobulin domain/Regulator of chromosome condensation (RCC1) repeat